MICLSCDSQNIEKKRVKSKATFKGDHIETISEKMLCKDCGESFLTEPQMSQFRRNLADAYREKNGLLKSEDIKNYRKKLGVSQIEFARMIGAGDSSVKRWETNRVQDRVYDMIIRSRCDPSYISDNIVKNMEDLAIEDEHTGYCKFRLSRYLQLLARIIAYTPTPLYYFKVLYMIDETHFLNYGATISGLRYAALEYGPVPEDYRRINEYIVKNGYASIKNVNSIGNFSIHVHFNKEDFTDTENEIIDQIIRTLKEKGKKYWFKKSHESQLYKKTNPYELIKFEVL